MVSYLPVHLYFCCQEFEDDAVLVSVCVCVCLAVIVLFWKLKSHMTVVDKLNL